MEDTNRVKSLRRKTLFGLAIGILAVLSLVAGVATLLLLPSGAQAGLNSAALSAGIAYYVSPTGSDSNPGTETQPLRTIGRAAAMVQPGSTVYIKAGTYREQVTASTSGAANNYITFRNYGSDQVVVDGECSRGHGFYITGSWIAVQGFTIKRTTEASILIDGTDPPKPSNVTIDDMTLQDFDCTWTSSDPSSWGQYRGGVAAWYTGSGIRITDNLIQHRTSGSPYGSADGIWFKGNNSNPSGGGHYIAGNTIIGGWDGIGGEEEGSAHGTFDRDSIVENNTVRDCWDDGIQSEGGDQNVRIRNNDVSGCGAGIAFAAPITGPLYIENNYIHDLKTGLYGNLFCFKVGNNGGATTYLTENVCDVDSSAEVSQGGADGIHQTNEGLSPIVSRRNTIHTSRYVFETTQWPRPAGESFDYDCMFSTDSSRFVKWGSAGGSAYYTSLSSFRAATGQEMNGQQSQDCGTSPTPIPTPTPTVTPTATPTPKPTPPPASPDSDGDSRGMTDVYGLLVFRNTVETFIGTNPYDACSGPGQDAWPPDISRDAHVTSIDALSFRGLIGAWAGDARYSRRLDLNTDGAISAAGDVLLLARFFGMSCTP